MAEYITWLRLYNRIGKQPVKDTKTKAVMVKHDGVFYNAKLVYNENGSDWYLETTSFDKRRFSYG